MADDSRTLETAPASASLPLYRRGAWGRLAMSLIPLVAATGAIIAFSYAPDNAWSSVAATAGNDTAVWRDFHRWGAELLVIAAWLHLLRVFVVGAFRRYPGWGLSVLCTVWIVATAATGWALRFDAGASTRIAESTLPAIYVLHILLLPGALVGSVWLWHRTAGRRTEAPETETR